MRRTSSRVSDESFISVEPAMARQITGSSRSGRSQKASRTTAASKKPPSAYVAPDTREENTKPRRKDSTRRDGSSKRSNSLKRVKNSTEILRQRSQKASSEPKNELPQSAREGRSFTVSNVGTGGMLYLRYDMRVWLDVLVRLLMLFSDRHKNNSRCQLRLHRLCLCRLHRRKVPFCPRTTTLVKPRVQMRA